MLDVLPGDQTPYYYIGDGQMQAFVRVGNESVVASTSKHKELVLKGSNMSYDSLVSRWRFEDSDYESFGIINEKGELTNAGALLADYSPVRHSRLFCTRMLSFTVITWNWEAKCILTCMMTDLKSILPVVLWMVALSKIWT